MMHVTQVLRVWMVYCLLGCLLSACGTAASPNPPASPPPAGPPTPHLQMPTTDGSDPKADLAVCPRLDSVLLPLAQTNDPATLAASMQLPYEDGRVLVVVTTDSDLDLAAYNALQTAQDGNVMQVLVPPDALCRLAQDPAVQRVAPPQLVIPTSMNLVSTS